MRTTRPILTILAAITWVTGGIVLLLKGSDLWLEARDLRSDHTWLWLALVGGLVFGSLKTKYIFDKACRKNLDRIASLSDPKLWQFYRIGFFFFLALMIATGATLSRNAHGNFPFLIGVATLDFSLAVALLGSSRNFLRSTGDRSANGDRDRQ